MSKLSRFLESRHTTGGGVCITEAHIFPTVDAAARRIQVVS